MKTSRIVVSLAMFIVMLTQNCKKDESSETTPVTPAPAQGTMEVRMTDGPGDFDKAYIDVREVWVNVESRGWVKLNMTRAGVYEITRFNNGEDTLIAAMNMEPGKIKQVKLIYGTQNNVNIGGIIQVTDNSELQMEGVVMDVDESVEANATYTLWIDIDVNKSFYHKNGKWWFKPWMRCFTHHKSGGIYGDVNPDGAAFYAYAVQQNNVNDTFVSILRSNGYFKLWGLRPGAYDLKFMSKGGTTVKSINAVNVTAGQVTNLGVVSIP